MDSDARLVEDGEDVALLSEPFFVVDGMEGGYFVVRRDAEYAATVVATFRDFDYAHFCARRLTEYAAKHEADADED